MKIKTLVGIFGLLLMTVLVFFGQTFCDFLNKDYGDWMHAALWTALTLVVLTSLLIISVVGMSKHGAHVKTWHIVGLVCFILFVGASCFMAAPSVVHTFTVLSRKGDIADKSREIILEIDAMNQKYEGDCKVRSNNLATQIKLAQDYRQYGILEQYFPDEQNVRDTSIARIYSEGLYDALTNVCDVNWGSTRKHYESKLVTHFSLFTGANDLKSLITYYKERHADYSDKFMTVKENFEETYTRTAFVPQTFDYNFVDYGTQVSDLFTKKTAHAAGILIFIFALLLGSFPFIFIKNNKVKNARTVKDGDGIYNQGYPLK